MKKKRDIGKRYNFLHEHPGILLMELGLAHFPKTLPKKLTPAAIMRVVKSINVVDANRTALRMINALSIAELQRNFHRLFSASSGTTAFLHVVADGRRQFRLEMDFQSFRGSLLSVLVCGYRTKEALLLVMVDVTAQKREGELDAFDRHQREVMVTLEEKEVVARQLLRIMSHELKTPLTPIQIRLNMLLDGDLGTLNKKQHASLILVIKNFERFNGLITNIVDASKLSRGVLQLALKRGQLEKTVRRVVRFVNPALRKKQINLILRMGTLPVIPFDNDRIEQVLFNLFDNACSFTPRKGTITITTKKLKNSVLVSVCNSGQSLAPAELERIFRPFYQVIGTDTRKKGGSGLGLTICSGIVIQHGGKVWAEEAQGGGVKISFTLPRTTKKLRIGRRKEK